jgi:hypothetical protein
VNKSDENNEYFTCEDLRIFMIISRRILFRMRNVSGSCRKNRNSHFMFNKCFPKIVTFMR